MGKRSTLSLVGAIFVVALLLLVILKTATSKKENAAMTIPLTSPAFVEGEFIPAKHTCDGEDVSPPLNWTGVPGGAKSLALICDDPDAPMGAWVHWVIFGLPPTVAELAENVPTTETLANGERQGMNDFKLIGYGGPCPPAGRPHRYFFKLYALDAEIPLKARATKKDLLRAMEGHVLGEGHLMGKYQRR